MEKSNTDAQLESKPDNYQQDVTIDTLTEDGKRILKSYSGLKEEEVLPHVLSIRDKGFAIAQFTCIGQVRFLNNRLPKLPYYTRILQKLHKGGKMVDVGCGLGQEFRYLVVDEQINANQLFGFDLEQGMIDLGFELFRDKDRFHADLFAADLLAPLEEQPRLKALQGSMAVVQVSHMLHMFDWDEMVEAAKRLVALATKTPGTMIVGSQIGGSEAGSYPIPRRNAGTGMLYRHNSESMTRFWNVVGEQTGSQWSVECAEIQSKAVEQNKHTWWAKQAPEWCMIYFCATRL